MFKKFIIAILLIISFVSSAPVQASSFDPIKQEQKGAFVMPIEKASYSETDGVFYVYTERDEDGGFWTMEFTPKKGETLAQFKKRAVGRYLIVTYERIYNSDDEVMITGKFIY